MPEPYQTLNSGQCGLLGRCLEIQVYTEPLLWDQEPRPSSAQQGPTPVQECQQAPRAKALRGARGRGERRPGRRGVAQSVSVPEHRASGGRKGQLLGQQEERKARAGPAGAAPTD